MENKTIINEPKIKLVLQDDEWKFENVDGIIVGQNSHHWCEK
jgi:hypothetical protein